MRARERGGGVGNERKKESKIHLCVWALVVGSRIHNYTMLFLEREMPQTKLFPQTIDLFLALSLSLHIYIHTYVLHTYI